MLEITTLSACFIIVLSIVICLALYIVYRLTLWRRLKMINTVFFSFKCYKRVIADVDQECIRKYGKIVGWYEFLEPMLFIADPNLINKILISNFADFPNHRDWVISDKPVGKSLFIVPYKEWKPMRAIISPSFTTGKLKNMNFVFEESIDSVKRQLDLKAKSGEIFDMKYVIECCLMDVLLRALFGVKIDTVKEPNNPFVMHAKNIFNTNMTFAQIVAFMYPKITKFFDIRIFDRNATDFFDNLSLKILEQRKKDMDSNGNKFDFLQYLTDAYNENDSSFKRTLSTKEVIDNCQLFYMAGFDTTSSGLVHILYYLATNIESQNRLIEEVASYSKLNAPIIDYFNQMPYLDACVKEGLRLDPPLPRIERVAFKDITLDNVFIPKSCMVSIPVYAVHRDPDNYDNPDQYIPERFLPENAHKLKPNTYLTFADGPRNCVGNRFALMEMKLILLHMFQHFRVVECETEKLDHYIGFPLHMPKQLMLKIEKLNE